MAGLYTVTSRADGELLTAAKYNGDRQAISDNLTSTALWTPRAEGSTGVGIATYTIQVGTYTRINDLLHWSFQIAFWGHTGTGNILVSGLPVTAAASPVINYVSTLWWSNITDSPPMLGPTYVSVISGSTDIVCYYIALSNSAFSALPMAAAATMMAQGFYRTA